MAASSFLRCGTIAQGSTPENVMTPSQRVAGVFAGSLGLARGTGARLALLATLVAMPGWVPAQEAATRSDAFSCSELMFRVLPGDYDFCIARKHWEKGNYKQALELMELAAGWGNKFAQGALGLAYFNGQSIGQDRALGLAWLQLAAERGDPRASALHLSALSKASGTEKEKARVLYLQMRGRYADEVAAARADRRYRREVFALVSNPVYGSGKCIVGANVEAIEPQADPLDSGSVGGTCSLAEEQAVIDTLRIYSDAYFDGWKGRVVVGPLEVLKQPE